MSLLSTDITKVKKLSLRGVNLPTPELRVETVIKKVDRPPTDEERAYSILVETNPLLQELVDRFKLVAPRKVKVDLPQLEIEKIEKPQPLVKEAIVVDSKIVALAIEILEPEDCYKEEDIIDRIIEATKVNRERANKGFNLMVEDKAIEVILGGWYILKGSTPF